MSETYHNSIIRILRSRTRLAVYVHIISAVLICTLLYCTDPASQRKETLRWVTAMELPVNMTSSVDIDSDLTPAGTMIDLGTTIISIHHDISEFFNKLTDHEAGYHLTVTNNTRATLTLYGLLFQDGDAAANMSTDNFYNLITMNSPIQLAAQNRIILFSVEDVLDPMETDVKTSDRSKDHPLCRMLLSYKNLSWRWMVQVENSVNSNNTNDITNSIDMQLRIKIAGINSFDSLLMY